MSIRSVAIKSFRSLSEVDLDLQQINCLLGPNGAGKTNVVRALHFFYENLVSSCADAEMLDRDNPYSEYLEISVTYDLSRLVGISRKNSTRQVPQQKFFKHVCDLATDNGNLVASLRQYKSGELQWNLGFEQRRLVKNLFPMYFIFGRHLNLENWDGLWDVIGDLTKKTLKSNSGTASNLEFSLEEKKVLEKLEQLLSESGSGVKQFTLKEESNHLFQLYFGGRSFEHNQKQLNYYSEGNNSFHYIYLIVSAIQLISQKKLKEPLVVLDEPEISLHTSFIDRLANVLFLNNEAVQTLFTTHSPRLVRNLMRGSSSYVMYHVDLKGSYSSFRKVREITSQKRERIRVSEHEASAFFAHGIIMVEGQTEMEVFSHPLLHRIYPELALCDLHAGVSDSVVGRLVHPLHRNTSVPFVAFADLDKIVKFNSGLRTFSIKQRNIVNPFSNEAAITRERFFYGEKRDQYYLRKRIEGLRKTTFQSTSHGVNQDSYFRLFKRLVADYCLHHSVVVFSSTVEGAIINEYSVSLFKEWLISTDRIKSTSVVDLLSLAENSTRAEANLLRYLFHGKTDYAQTLDECCSIEPTFESTLEHICQLRGSKFDKTSGWISEFFDYVDENKLACLNLECQREVFADLFPELNDAISKILLILFKGKE